MLKTTDLSAYNNSGYNAGPLIKRMLWYLVSLMFFRNALFPFYGFKTLLLRAFGAKVGRGLVIKPYVNIKYPWFLTLGDHCWIGELVWIDNLADVSIGDHVCVSQGALILSGNHNYAESHFPLMLKPIVLENGVWIGAKAIVCGGSKCLSHAVLRAGSVTAGVLVAYSVYAGNPAVKAKERVIN